MKFGFRKPSFKRSFSAATKGAATRAFKRAILPGYGQKGKGYYSGYRKLLYNRVYSLTTASILDLFKSPKQKNPQFFKEQTEKIAKKRIAISLRQDGLKQYAEVTNFIKENQELPLNKSIQNSIKRLHSYADRYLDKGVYCGEDLYQFLQKNINCLKDTAVKGVTQYECTITLDIINQLKLGIDNKNIIKAIQEKYSEKKNSDFPTNASRKEFPNNPNGIEEGKQQLEVFNELSAQISKGEVFMPAIHIKLLNLVVKYYGLQRKKVAINLYDYFEYELTQKLTTSKREATKSEYQQALDIVNMLKSDKTVDEIYEFLQRRYNR